MPSQIRLHQQTASGEDDPDLLRHIQAMGFSSIGQYQEWCAEHGFHRRLQKGRHQRRREVTVVARANADQHLARSKHENRNPLKLIERIFRGELRECDVEQPHLREICRATTASAQNRPAPGPLLQLLTHVAQYTELVSSQPVSPEVGREEGNTFVSGLLNLARHSGEWMRPVEEWRPRRHNKYRQFSELARHLFARWPVPTFMDSVWFAVNSKEARRHQRWFLHLGRGENIRTASLPILYTKKMAHFFMQAPADLNVFAAIRWGQVFGSGGDARLARGILGTRLRTSFKHDDFWTSVIRFFIANPMLDPEQLGPIVDYLHHERFESEQVFVAPGRIEQIGPRQPNLSMKGRTAESLLRQVENWHRELGLVRQIETDWPASGIPAYEFVEGAEQSGNRRMWTIRELLSSKALAAEGRKMRHCVASYAGSCARRRSSIWTLEEKSCEGHQKILTIEVNLMTRQICQARGKCNALPTERQRSILRRWAEFARLGLARFA